MDAEVSKETANDINHPIGLKLDEAHKAQVRHTLEVLLHSSAFSTAQRSRRFISYVVEQALSGLRRSSDASFACPPSMRGAVAPVL